MFFSGQLAGSDTGEFVIGVGVEVIIITLNGACALLLQPALQQTGGAYVFNKKHGFDALLDKTANALGERVADVDALLKLLLPLNTRQAEIVATLYAAWNNLLLLGRSPQDEDIVCEARENWHELKLNIDREKFFKGLGWMRRQGLVPAGRGRYVPEKGKRKTTRKSV